jgi:hypothetical protein
VRNSFLGDAPIPVVVILKICPEVTPENLESAAKRVADKETPPRFLEQDLTDLEKWRCQQGVTLHTIAYEHYLDAIRLGLQHLAGRKTDWTLLGIKSLESLYKTVNLCFGVSVLDSMKKTKCLSTENVQLLLARAMSLGQKRTKKPNSRTSAQRAISAIKSNNTKPSTA